MSSLTVRRVEVIFLLSLTLAAFGVRAYRAGSVGLAEDEVGKWLAIQQCRQGHFVGVNSEHPMMMKLLAWAGLEIGARWNRWVGEYGGLRVSEEVGLRMPNLMIGALTTVVIYLLGKEMFGAVGAGLAAFAWALTPLPIALTRILKEDALAARSGPGGSCCGRASSGLARYRNAGLGAILSSLFKPTRGRSSERGKDFSP